MFFDVLPAGFEAPDAHEVQQVTGEAKCLCVLIVYLTYICVGYYPLKIFIIF